MPKNKVLGSITLACPNCASTQFKERSTYRATADVLGWNDAGDGTFYAEPNGETEINWDSGTIEMTRPYQCQNCFRSFNADELKRVGE